MEKHTQYVTMNDGHEVFVTTFTPLQQAIGHMHILHGMAEHSARYNDFAEMLCAKGYFVSTHDHRGHGYTVERNGHLGYFADENGFDRIVRDVFGVLQKVRQGRKLPNVTLFGHSMGSFIARRYMQLFSETISNVILCGTGATTPQHYIGNHLANILVKRQGPFEQSHLMTSLSFGSFNNSFTNVKTSFDWICSDPAEVQKYIDDPKCGFIATNQFFVDLTDGLLLLNKKGENSRVRPDLPVLFISGSEDPVSDKGKGVFQVAQQLTSAGVETVKVHLFEGMRHEVLKEPKKQQAYEIILRWVEHDK